MRSPSSTPKRSAGRPRKKTFISAENEGSLSATLRLGHPDAARPIPIECVSTRSSRTPSNWPNLEILLNSKPLPQICFTALPPSPVDNAEHRSQTSSTLPPPLYDMDDTDKAWIDALPCSISYTLFEQIITYLEQLPLPNPMNSPQDMEDDSDTLCAVCNIGVSTDSNQILFCEGNPSCNLTVHQTCYGIPHVPESKWLCRVCIDRGSLGSEEPRCVLCPGKSGALKKSTDGEWVHVLCAIWIPEVLITNRVLMDGIDVRGIPKARISLRCFVCGNAGRDSSEAKMACIQCCVDNCFTSYHVSCAVAVGLYMDSFLEVVPSNVEREAAVGDGLRSCCDIHSSGFMTKKVFGDIARGHYKVDAIERRIRDFRSGNPIINTPWVTKQVLPPSLIKRKSAGSVRPQMSPSAISTAPISHLNPISPPDSCSGSPAKFAPSISSDLSAANRPPKRQHTESLNAGTSAHGTPTKRNALLCSSTSTAKESSQQFSECFVVSDSTVNHISSCIANEVKDPLDTAIRCVRYWSLKRAEKGWCIGGLIGRRVEVIKKLKSPTIFLTNQYGGNFVQKTFDVSASSQEDHANKEDHQLCHTLHKKCGLEKPSCSRCVDGGYDCCWYADPVSNKLKTSTGTGSGATSSTDSSSPESLIVLAPPMGLEDPDLMPTMADYSLVYTYLLAGDGPQLLAVVDGVRFLQNFFHTHPALRLAICARAAWTQRSTVPEHLWMMYFERAKKALSRYEAAPTVQMVQALIALAAFTPFAFNDMFIALPFLQKALVMMLRLRIDVDPDECHWLNLSEEAKEERRIVYWVIYFIFKRKCSLGLRMSSKQIAGAQIVVHNPMPKIHGSMKFARQLPTHKLDPSTYLNYGAYDPNRPVATVSYLCSLLDIAYDSTVHHRIVPTSASDILMSPVTKLLLTRLKGAELKIPGYLLLSSTNDTLANFLQSNGTVMFHGVSVLDILMTTMLYNSIMSILLRPTLYLTAFLDIASPTLVEDSGKTILVLLTILETCVRSARTVTALNSWVLTSGDAKLKSTFFLENHFTYFALFESAVVLWFVTCRTQAFWWKQEGGTDNTLRMSLEDRKRIRSEVLDLLKTLKGLAENERGRVGAGSKLMSGHIRPICHCIQGMLDEMEKVEDQLGRGYVINDERQLDEIVIGLQVLEINGEVAKVEEPWVFLGLLGMQVNGCYRWNATNEEEWKSFWKSLK
ncbi:Bromodomain-containing protein 1 [Rhizoclosmatium sp. JEL0117]|nr:Bromodomain-containing protein 1 [Rhizoclosmatium sp. JEL0117]